MGLDMYLTANTFKADGRCKGGVRKVSKEIGYWRKANQIRRWLVDNNIVMPDDNCTDRRVSLDLLKALKQDCQTVLADNSKARDILPLEESGFFFGMYDGEKGVYQSEWYIGDLEDTVRIIEECEALEKVSPTVEFVYSDWW